MATALLIEFDSDQMAEAFVKKVNGEVAYVPVKRIRVTGMWRLPKTFCECTDTARMKMRAFVRGKKYGWWVHTQCGRPSKYWGQAAPRLWLSLGRNILPGVPDDGEPRSYSGHVQDHDAAMVQALEDVGAPIIRETRRRKQRAERPRRL